MQLRGICVLAIALAFCWLSVARANVDEQRLVVEMAAEKIVVTTDEHGEKIVRRVAPQTLLPGEEVIYTLTYRNTHPDQADDVVITNPIDPNLRYQSGTALGDDTEVVFSVDGGNSFASPAQLQVLEADGTARPANPDDYTHIRWIRIRPVQTGHQGHVSFSARVR